MIACWSEALPGAMAPTPITDTAAADQPSSDGGLLSRILMRDEQALDILYQRYGGLVYRLAVHITTDEAIAEEVTQDVFHAVWHTAATFDPQRSLIAWLIGITRHRAIDATRSRFYRARHREFVIDPLQLQIPQAESYSEYMALHETVQLALKHLPALQRQALELAYFRDMTCVEIAAHLGEPLGTVKSRIRHGLQRLRVLFESEWGYHTDLVP